MCWLTFSVSPQMPFELGQFSTDVKLLIGHISTGITRSSADADKPVRRVSRSVKVTKHSTIPHVRNSFLLCNSNFVFKTCRFYDIRLQKMSWPWNGVKGHSRSLRAVSINRLCMVSYWCSLVTLSLKCSVFEIFNFKNAVTLKPRLGVTEGHWKCHRVMEHISLPIDVL